MREPQCPKWQQRCAVLGILSNPSRTTSSSNKPTKRLYHTYSSRTHNTSTSFPHVSRYTYYKRIAPRRRGSAEGKSFTLSHKDGSQQNKRRLCGAEEGRNFRIEGWSGVCNVPSRAQSITDIVYSSQYAYERSAHPALIIPISY